jgi:hypothetical protein
VRELPPGLLAGVRFLLAGLVLGALALSPRSDSATVGRGTGAHAAILAIAFIVLGNGMVTWAAAVGAIQPGRADHRQFGAVHCVVRYLRRRVACRSARATKLGLFAGLIGTGLLVWPDGSTRKMRRGGDLLWPKAVDRHVDARLVLGRNAQPQHATVSMKPLMYTACQMLIGGGGSHVDGDRQRRAGALDLDAAGASGACCT